MKGKPDIELVDMTSRFRTIDDIMEVTTKPIIFDGDTGGLTEHFVYTVRSLERMGVSMIIIEDKTGLKKNSLFGTFNAVCEEEWKELGANIIIYANQLTRTGFPAMQNAARTILEKHRAKECDDMCMSIKDIITLIPEE